MAHSAPLGLLEQGCPIQVEHDRKRRQFTVRLNGKERGHGGYRPRSDPGYTPLGVLIPPCYPIVPPFLYSPNTRPCHPLFIPLCRPPMRLCAPCSGCFPTSFSEGSTRGIWGSLGWCGEPHEGTGRFWGHQLAPTTSKWLWSVLGMWPRCVCEMLDGIPVRKPLGGPALWVLGTGFSRTHSTMATSICRTRAGDP